MAVLPASVGAAPRPDAAAPASPRALPRGGPSRFVPADTFLFRLVVAAGLTAVAFLPVYAELLAEALNGSRSAYLLVVPVLLAVIAVGYRVPPQGVRDAESDWIVAAVIGVVGFTGIHLMSSRLPTLAGLWELRLLGLPLWLGCLTAVMFGLRHAVRMWPLWVFAFCSTPLPYLLTVAMLGGSDTSAALVAATLGAIAAYLGGRLSSRRWRLGAALGCVAVSTAVVVIAPRIGLLALVVVVGAVLPVIASAVLYVRQRAIGVHAPHRYPALSPVSLGALAVASVVLATLQPSTHDGHALPMAQPDWTQRAQLRDLQNFPFITRHLGESASLHRFSVPEAPGLPAAAVDVLSSPDLAALQTYSDAVWYPANRPLDYRPADVNGLTSRLPGAEVIHTNIATATDGTSQNWYALTWVWQVADTYQRVTVVVNQDRDSSRQPPAPVPLSPTNSVIEPALWIARQQKHAEGPVDPRVIRRVVEVTNAVLASAADDGRAAGAPTGA